MTTASDATLLIGSAWRSASDGSAQELVSPVDGSVTGAFAQASASDLDDAVAAAVDAARNGSWSTLSDYERSLVVNEFADLVEADLEQLALLQAREMGKPVGFSLERDVPCAVSALRYCAGLAARSSTSRRLPAALTSTRYDLSAARGVVAAFGAVQHPVAMMIDALAPALALGNTVVFKPSAHAALSAVRLAELARQAGLPAGVLNLVTGSDPRLGLALAAHPAIDMVAYTGSRAGARVVGAACMRTLTPVRLKANGTTAHVVFADTCLDSATRLAVRSMLTGRLEARGMGVRILVHRPVYRSFLAQLQERLEELLPGDPTLADTRLGPLPHQRCLTDFRGFLGRLEERGAKIVLGGETDSLYVRPTLITGAPLNSGPACEHESAAPYALVEPFDTPAEALVGLTGLDGLVRLALHTPSRERAAWLVSHARAETCLISTCEPGDQDEHDDSEDEVSDYDISAAAFEGFARDTAIVVDW
ncbi:aldehyde dehydrogenase family protein [Actinospica robiniae]|uniref:aldehyde dehydrogenase family protein n=1 Tax=Actinospica robiniae TaxID=304901 RepID=UPI00040AA24C|nr:aldehyde dehydrogenase family protein [Actinospica robiniae]